MPRIDNKKFYISAITKYGITPKGVNWSSKHSQQIRFDMILEMLPQNLNLYNIVDAGCGFGDFYIYLQKKKLLPKNYIGIDILSDMYSIASEKTGCEILIADITKDILPYGDYFICSGAMNILNRFETELFIRRCYEHSRRGFIFNILHGDEKNSSYNYMTTLEIKKIADNLHVQRLELYTGYLDGDITVGLFKD